MATDIKQEIHYVVAETYDLCQEKIQTLCGKNYRILQKRFVKTKGFLGLFKKDALEVAYIVLPENTYSKYHNFSLQGVPYPGSGQQSINQMGTKDMIVRTLQQRIEENLFKGKAIIVIGARQVGKSTLFRQIVDGRPEKVLSLNCDEPEVKEMLSGINTPELKMLIGNHRIVVIDEAQRVKEIGMTLKRITDNFPEVQLMVTGSSSLELQDRINEPLTGRKYEYHLYPISTRELLNDGGLLAVKQSLEARLIYGSYPDIVNRTEEAKELIMNIASSYLYKDLLALEDIRRPALLEKLLIALALQVGSEVSYNELAQTVGSDSKTVEKYIDLLEKCYIVFRLNAFNRNLRNELKKSKKVYFLMMLFLGQLYHVNSL